MELLEIWNIIKQKEFVDLTHTFEPGIPHWPGFIDQKDEILYWYEPGIGTKGSGFYVQYFSHVGQWGTHVDPPSHFINGKRNLDEIDVKEMIMPLIVIDVHEVVESNPDYVVNMVDVKNWEIKHGQIPPDSFVVLRTDWSKRWPSMDNMLNRDEKGLPHFPGWSLEVLKYLYEDCKIMANGHETTDTDPGFASGVGDYSLEYYVLNTNHYQIELLANLDKVPEYGALAIASFPKPKKGSGFPARVFAILP